ncbi:MAG TPA: nitroreductase family deazaflavin-dependent oxidoreductase [Pseudolysinimonas sp.]|jgi:deazaflavin-dependent oxidoreductase (nitroreductase family)
MSDTKNDSRAGMVRVGTAVLGTRWLVRAPIVLFRAGLGFLFGGRLMLLEHTGRTSGLARYVALEVVSRPARGSFVVASGFGTKAQWYRNVVAHPEVRVRWSIRPSAAAIARPLDPQESAAIISAYADEHPRTWAKLSPVFAATLGAPVEGPDAALPLVRFDLVARGN